MKRLQSIIYSIVLLSLSSNMAAMTTGASYLPQSLRSYFATSPAQRAVNMRYGASRPYSQAPSFAKPVTFFPQSIKAPQSLQFGSGVSAAPRTPYAGAQQSFLNRWSPTNLFKGYNFSYFGRSNPSNSFLAARAYSTSKNEYVPPLLALLETGPIKKALIRLGFSGDIKNKDLDLINQVLDDGNGGLRKLYSIEASEYPKEVQFFMLLSGLPLATVSNILQNITPQKLQEEARKLLISRLNELKDAGVSDFGYELIAVYESIPKIQENKLYRILGPGIIYNKKRKNYISVDEFFKKHQPSPELSLDDEMRLWRELIDTYGDFDKEDVEYTLESLDRMSKEARRASFFEVDDLSK